MGLSFQCHKATDIYTVSPTTVTLRQLAEPVFCGVCLSFVWGFFSMGRTWMSPDRSLAVKPMTDKCKAACLLPGAW